MNAYYNENTLVYLNGEYIKASDAKCNIYSQSLHYGYAVFEGMRSYNTGKGAKIFKAKEHFERLLFSAKRLHIPFEYGVADLTEITYAVLEKNNMKDAYIRPLVYSSLPNMQLVPSKESALFIAAWEWGKYLGDRQVRLMVSSYQRPNPGAFHIEAKATGHYVNSILASNEAKSKGYDEALLLDGNGYIAEGPGANFFFEKNGTLYTPPRGNILPGITRNTIMDLAKETGIAVEEKHFTVDDLENTDGAFFTGTAAEVTGIESVNEIKFNLPFNKTLGAMLSEKYRDVVYEVKSDLVI